MRLKSRDSDLQASPAGRRAVRPGFVAVPAWQQQFPWLRAGFSTRWGGVSEAYREAESEIAGTQNLGYTAEDSVGAVAGNRRNLVGAVARGASMQLVTMSQTHGCLVRIAEGDPQSLATPEGRAVFSCDGLLTRQPGLLLGVLTADCVPVLLADTRTRAVAGFHAGWRGTLARIVERGIETMRSEFGSSTEDLVAAVGPAIGSCCFAVGDEVRTGFDQAFAYSPALFSTADGLDSQGRLHMNLAEANRRQLLDAGLRPSAIEMINECTACSRLHDGRRKYFSYRAERGLTGRMLSLIGAAAELQA